TIEVEIVALDDFLANKSIAPNIIKIDVEGYELHVLKGSKDVMLKLKPTIFCEIHKFNWDVYSSSEDVFWDLLNEVKYRVTDIKGEELTDFPYYGHVVLCPLE
ncbi:MAG: FkbM family methyltransferase, partial [Candidatus Methanomethylicaceae archaeon]